MESWEEFHKDRRTDGRLKTNLEVEEDDGGPPDEGEEERIAIDAGLVVLILRVLVGVNGSRVISSGCWIGEANSKSKLRECSTSGSNECQTLRNSNLSSQRWRWRSSWRKQIDVRTSKQRWQKTSVPSVMYDDFRLAPKSSVLRSHENFAF